MTDLFYKTLGVESATFSFGGPNFLDSHGYFMDNVFGDMSTTCNTVTNPATSARLSRRGDHRHGRQRPHPVHVGSAIQMGTALTANVPLSYSNEVVIVTTTTATSSASPDNPLRFTHPTTAQATVFRLLRDPVHPQVRGTELPPSATAARTGRSRPPTRSPT